MHLGSALYARINDKALATFSSLTPEEQQKLLMVLAPKLILNLTQGSSWRISLGANLRYGGEFRAPMVTWIVRFTHDASVYFAPDATYRSALACILHFVGTIDQSGQLVMADANTCVGQA
jgi:hypothetical protein